MKNKFFKNYFISFIFALLSFLVVSPITVFAQDVIELNDTTPISLQEAIDNIDSEDETTIIINSPDLIALDAAPIQIVNKNLVLDLNGSIISGSNLVRVFKISGGNVTIENGTVQNGFDENSGGAIYIDDEANVSFIDVNLTNNISKTGAGIYINSSNVTFTGTESPAQVSGNNGYVYTLQGSTGPIEFRNGGGAFYLNKGSIEIENVEIKNNINYSGGTSYSAGLYVNSDSSAILNNVNFIENRSPGIIDIFNKGNLIANNCDFINSFGVNEDTDNAADWNGTVIGTDGSSSITTLNDCTIANNKYLKVPISVTNSTLNLNGCTIGGKIDEVEAGNLSTAAGAIYMTGGTINIENSFIENNKAKYNLSDIPGATALNSVSISGGIYQTAGTIILKNSTIKNNDAELYADGEFSITNLYAAGGVYFEKYTNYFDIYDSVITDNSVTYADYISAKNENTAGGVVVKANSWYFDFYSGAIFNNSNVGEAQDIFFGSKTAFRLMQACEMVDGGKSFENYYWRDLDGSFFDGNLKPGNEATYIYWTDDKQPLHLQAYHVNTEPVASYNDEEYLSLEQAVNAARTDSSSQEKLITLIGEEETIIENTPNGITIDFQLILDLNGHNLDTSSSKQTTLFDITSDGKLTLEGNGNIKKTISNSGELILNGSFGDLSINLKNNAKVNIGNEFDKVGNITFILDLTGLEGINTDNEVSRTIISGDTSKIESDQIYVKDLNNPNIIVEKDPTSISIINPKINSELIYTKDKESLQSLVEKAEELNEDTVYLQDTYKVTGETTISSDSNITIKRISENYNGNYENMIDVQRGTLTLSNITIDGGSSDTRINDNNLINFGSIINIENSGELVIEDGTILQNNNIKDNTIDSYLGSRSRSGGGIYSRGKITMNGGTIQNCSALLGGAIDCDYGEFTMNGGLIQNNTASGPVTFSFGTYYGCGGGVLLDHDAKMQLLGGWFINNSADDGGAISVGTSSYTVRYQQVPWESLVIGKDNKVSAYASVLNNEYDDSTILFEGNKAVRDGGAIYVQCYYSISIYEGDFYNNEVTSGAGRTFGGGALYVNGETGYPNGIAKIYNILIKDNEAKLSGGAIAACPTSETEIYLADGSVIYDNYGYVDRQFESDGWRDDILVSTYDQADSFNGSKEFSDYVSLYMLDGTPYNWKDVNTNEYASESLLDNNSGLNIYSTGIPNEETINNNIRVRMIGNKSVVRGGAIGSNGDIIIGGEYSKPEKFEVTKTWENIGTDQNYPSDVNQVNIWLFRKNTESSQIDLLAKESLRDEKNNWKDSVSFSKLKDTNYTPIIVEEIKLTDGTTLWSYGENSGDKDSLENLIKSIVSSEKNISEDDVQVTWTDSIMSSYTSTIENENGNYKLVNSHKVTSLTLTKKVEGIDGTYDPDKAYSFTISLKDSKDNDLTGSYQYRIKRSSSDDVRTGTFPLTITLKKDETVVIENLPIGTKYSIVENINDDDEFSSEFRSGNGTGILSSKNSSVQVINRYVDPEKPEDPVVKKEEIRIEDTDIGSDEFTRIGDSNRVSGPVVAEGDEITYRISFENVNASDGTVTITDLLDDGVDFVSATNGGVYDSDTHTVTWIITGVTPETKGYVELTVKVNNRANNYWNYDSEDPSKPNYKNDGDSLNNPFDHHIINQASVIVDNEVTVTDQIINPIEGLYIEKLHMIVSTQELGDSYRNSDLFDEGDVFKLPLNADDPADGHGFTNLLDDDTDDNNYKKLFDHSPGNTVRYYLKVTNNGKDDLDHVVIVDPVKINSREDTSDALTNFNGIAGTISNTPNLEARSQSNVTSELVGNGPNEDGVLTFKIYSSWNESWGDAKVNIEDRLPQGYSLVAAYYESLNNPPVKLEGSQSKDGEIVTVKGQGAYSDTEISINREDGENKVIWTYSIEDTESEDENIVYIQIKPDPDTEINGDYTCGTLACVIENIVNLDDEYERDVTNEVKAIFNQEDIDKDGKIGANEGYIRWELDTLPGTKTASERFGADGFEANVQIVYFDWDIPTDTVDQVTTWENTAYVQTMDNILLNLQSLDPDRYQEYLQKLEEHNYDTPDITNPIEDAIDSPTETYSSNSISSVELYSGKYIKSLAIAGTSEDEISVTDESTYDIDTLNDTEDEETESVATIDNEDIIVVDTNDEEAPTDSSDFVTEDKSNNNHVSIYSEFGWPVLIQTMIPSNTVVERIQTGDLIISKSVTGLGDKEKDFEFDITLTYRNELSESLEYPNLPGTFNIYDGDEIIGEVVNGNGSFTLKDGESLRIENLPLGTLYKIEETNADGYNISGTIIAPVSNDENSENSETTFNGGIAEGEIKVNDSVITVEFVNDIPEKTDEPDEPGDEENKDPNPPSDPSGPDEPGDEPGLVDKPDTPDNPGSDNPPDEPGNTPDTPSNSDGSNNQPSGNPSTPGNNNSQSTTTQSATNSTITKSGGSPKTGVSAGLGIFGSLIALSGTGLVINKKRKKK